MYVQGRLVGRCSSAAATRTVRRSTWRRRASSRRCNSPARASGGAGWDSRQRSSVPAVEIGNGSPLMPLVMSSTSGALRRTYAVHSNRASCTIRANISRATQQLQQGTVHDLEQAEAAEQAAQPPQEAAALVNQRSAAPASLLSCPGTCGNTQVSASSRTSSVLSTSTSHGELAILQRLRTARCQACAPFVRTGFSRPAGGSPSFALGFSPYVSTPSIIVYFGRPSQLRTSRPRFCSGARRTVHSGKESRNALP